MPATFFGNITSIPKMLALLSVLGAWLKEPAAVGLPTQAPEEKELRRWVIPPGTKPWKHPTAVVNEVGESLPTLGALEALTANLACAPPSPPPTLAPIISPVSHASHALLWNGTLRWSSRFVHEFSRVELATALRGQWVLFAGDSVTRDLFLAVKTLLLPGGSRAGVLESSTKETIGTCGDGGGSRVARNMCASHVLFPESQLRLSFQFLVHAGASHPEVVQSRKAFAANVTHARPSAVVLGCPVFAFVDKTAYAAPYNMLSGQQPDTLLSGGRGTNFSSGRFDYSPQASERAAAACKRCPMR